MQKISEKFLGLKDSFYRKDNYQAYIAAFLAKAKGKKTVLKLSAGQGKTFIIMMLTKYHVDLKKTVSIVVPSPLLKKQMKQYLDLYIASPLASICTVSELKQEDKAPDVFLCDEFDFMLENQAVTYEKSHDQKLVLCGLPPIYHSNRAYLISATFDQYHKKLLNQVFDIEANSIIEMKTVQEVSTGKN